MVGNGSEELRRIALELKTASAGGLRREMLRGLRSGAAPLIPLVQQAARDKLPSSGGLNEQVSGQKVKVSVRTGARTAGVRLTTTAPDTSQTDAGYVRHPVFGRRSDKWVTQPIPNAAGWWSQTLADSAPLVTPELLAVLESIARKIQGI